jgi:hypothetical protein
MQNSVASAAIICSEPRMAAFRILPEGGRTWPHAAALLALAGLCAGARAADFDLCVRGTTPVKP